MTYFVTDAGRTQIAAGAVADRLQTVCRPYQAVFGPFFDRNRPLQTVETVADHSTSVPARSLLRSLLAPCYEGGREGGSD